MLIAAIVLAVLGFGALVMAVITGVKAWLGILGIIITIGFILLFLDTLNKYRKR